MYCHRRHLAVGYKFKQDTRKQVKAKTVSILTMATSARLLIKGNNERKAGSKD